VLIENNLIKQNLVKVPWNSGGGGVDLYNITVDNGKYILRNNIIEYNKVQIKENWKAWGGGVACHINLPFNGEFVIANNTIRNNSLECVNTFGNGIYITFWQQADITDKSINPKVYNNLIYNNSSSQIIGSAISVYNVERHKYPLADFTPKPLICNNTIVNNGGNSAIHIYQSHPVIINNIIDKKNKASDDFDFGGVKSYNGIELYNNLFHYNNTQLADSAFEYYKYNLFGLDPLLIEDTYELTELSPCVGNGIDSIKIDGIWYQCPRDDINGNPRPHEIDKFVDIGATESPYAQVVSVDESVIDLPNKFQLNQNYPNPFNPRTMIHWQLVKSDDVELTVYNVLGKKIAVLVSKQMNPGNYNYSFDGSDLASGVYYYKLQSGNDVAVRKMILLR
jgi:hypothetical protein